MASSKFNYGNLPVLEFKCEEGARTVTTTTETARGDVISYSWADAIGKGSLLKLDATNSRSFTVMNRTVSDSTLVGVANAKPELPGGKLPISGASDESNPDAVNQRTVGVEIYALFTRMVEIDDGGTLPTLGQSIQPSAVAGGLHVWDRDTTVNNTLVIDPGTVGVKDTCIMWFYLGASW